jgi:hypothetical protein
VSLVQADTGVLLSVSTFPLISPMLISLPQTQTELGYLENPQQSSIRSLSRASSHTRLLRSPHANAGMKQYECGQRHWQKIFIREYLREFSKKFKTAPIEYLGAWGTLIHEKKLKSKISCQTPFKLKVPYNIYLRLRDLKIEICDVRRFFCRLL